MTVQGGLYPAMSCWHGFCMTLGSQAMLKYPLLGMPNCVASMSVKA